MDDKTTTLTLPREKAKTQAPKFGTFLGVYLPSLLTILGLIMYLRFGWVVGNIGLAFTILVVLLASSITFITGLSASAISTNIQVGVGGEYFMISRSLGLELGGAIGIPLYLCRTLSITFYCFGLAEAIVMFFPDTGLPPDRLVQMLAAGIIVIVTLLSSKSASFVLKLQIPIFIAVGLSVLALVFGVLTGGFRQPEWEATYRTAPEGFWYVFAVFFPAVTGFTAGIGMSGDLKDPQKSIPLGTMGAIFTGLALYILIPILISVSAKMSPGMLANSGVETWTNIAVLGAWLVFPAIWGAILSSAFGSVLSGPRVLQALANDGLAPGVFGRLSKDGQPALATWVSGGIALLAVALGGLNTVAQFVSILFLTLYVMVNLSAVIEKIVGDPFYRPTINVPWFVSLLGAVGAILVMFLISPLACLLAVLFEAGLYIFIRGRALHKQWGDVRAGFWFVLARYALINHRPHGKKLRTWRPYLLVFTPDVHKQAVLLRLASWFSQNRGIVTVCQLIEGDLRTDAFDLIEREEILSNQIKEEGIAAFGEVNIVSDFESGAINAAQANGIAGVKSNTVLFGWPENPERLASQLRIMRALDKTGTSTLIAKLNWGHEPGQKMHIDLWWGGRQRNGDLMLLLAYLLKSNSSWKEALITVRSIVKTEEEREMMENSLRPLIPRARIKARIEVVVKKPEEAIVDTMHRYSKNSDVTFVGLRIPEPGTEADYSQQLIALSKGLNTTIFVHNGESRIPVLLSLDDL